MIWPFPKRKKLYDVELFEVLELEAAIDQVWGAEEIIWVQLNPMQINAGDMAADLLGSFESYLHSGRAPFREPAAQALRKFKYDIADLQRYGVSLFSSMFVRDLRSGKAAANIAVPLMVVPSNFSRIELKEGGRRCILHGFE